MDDINAGYERLSELQVLLLTSAVPSLDRFFYYFFLGYSQLF